MKLLYSDLNVTDVFDAAKSITHPIALAAYLAAAVMTYYIFRDISRRKAIASAKTSERADVIIKTAEKIHLDINAVPENQRADLIKQTLKNRIISQIILAVAVIIVGLIVAITVIYQNETRVQPQNIPINPEKKPNRPTEHAPTPINDSVKKQKNGNLFAVKKPNEKRQSKSSYSAASTKYPKNNAIVVVKTGDSALKALLSKFDKIKLRSMMRSDSGKDVPSIHSRDNYYIWKDYAANEGGVIFWTDCQDCDWKIKFNGNSYIMSFIDTGPPSKLSNESAIVKLIENKSYEFTIENRVGQGYTRSITGKSGVTILIHIAKESYKAP